jgi:hypothetical protein
MVAAAGNDGSEDPIYPAAFPEVMGVAAVDPLGRKADFSNYGSFVDIAAPGVDLTTTDISGSGGFSIGDYYRRFSGTSGAAPVVAGVVSLLLSLHPDWSVEDVWERLCSTARPVSGLYYEDLGCGIVDARAALSEETEGVELLSPGAFLRSPVVVSTSYLPRGERVFTWKDGVSVSAVAGALVPVEDGEEVEVRGETGGSASSLFERTASSQVYLFYFPRDPVSSELRLRCVGLADSYLLKTEEGVVEGDRCDFSLHLSPGLTRLWIGAKVGSEVNWLGVDYEVSHGTPGLDWVAPGSVLGGFARGENRLLVKGLSSLDWVEFHYRECDSDEDFSIVRLSRSPDGFYTGSFEARGGCVEYYLSYYSSTEGVEVRLPLRRDLVVERGDVDCDGRVSEDDLELEEVLFGVEREWTTLYSENKDATGDGTVDERDLLKLALEVWK